MFSADGTDRTEDVLNRVRHNLSTVYTGRFSASPPPYRGRDSSSSTSLPLSKDRVASYKRVVARHQQPRQQQSPANSLPLRAATVPTTGIETSAQRVPLHVVPPATNDEPTGPLLAWIDNRLAALESRTRMDVRQEAEERVSELEAAVRELAQRLDANSLEVNRVGEDTVTVQSLLRTHSQGLEALRHDVVLRRQALVKLESWCDDEDGWRSRVNGALEHLTDEVRVTARRSLSNQASLGERAVAEDVERGLEECAADWRREMAQMQRQLDLLQEQVSSAPVMGAPSPSQPMAAVATAIAVRVCNEVSQRGISPPMLHDQRACVCKGIARLEVHGYACCLKIVRVSAKSVCAFLAAWLESRTAGSRYLDKLDKP
eukprot:TRINITY_DN4325_c1_g1_i2.p1 TRINITY_DN4325_c1_g1~~TRINITY_DN4325_c1_g1_i2.p1  ORF type:complete len:374 (-),score=57.45 TRINITY_DN4325_c1_g1_i2:385-1506(-)